MGDRGNIKVISSFSDPVYLYTHWGGSELPEIAKAALIVASDDGASTPPHNNRWDDGGKLARCVFQAMVGDDQGVLGFGISTKVIDNEHPIIVLDSTTRTVRTEGDRWSEGSGDKSWTMADYIASDDPAALIGFER